MLSAKEIQDKYYNMIIHDQNVKQIVESITENLYSSTVNDNIPYVFVRFDVITAKKIAFALRALGYHVKEYKHGKLHIFLQEGGNKWD